MLAPHVGAADGYQSGSVFQRAAELQAFLEDPKIGAIFTTIGGFNCAELLPRLDVSRFRDRPKIVLGYSDTSALLAFLTSVCGWVTFSGPALLPQLGEYPRPLPYTSWYLERLLKTDTKGLELTDPSACTDEFLDWGGGEWQQRPRAMRPCGGREIWREGHGEGYLFGGNIETLNFLIGTEYLRWPDPMMLFIEATEAEAFLPRLHRSLTHFLQCGVFDRVRGLLVGRCPDAKAWHGVQLRDVVTRSLSDYSFPILGEMSFGHSDPMLTLPMGVRTVLDASSADAKVRLLESSVSAGGRGS